MCVCVCVCRRAIGAEAGVRRLSPTPIPTVTRLTYCGDGRFFWSTFLFHPSKNNNNNNNNNDDDDDESTRQRRQRRRRRRAEGHAALHLWTPAIRSAIAAGLFYRVFPN